MSQKSNRPVDWETLVARNENRLYRAALAILGSPQEAEDAALSFFPMPSIRFQDLTRTPESSASRAFPPGCFTVDLAFEDIQKLFWGPEGVPETHQAEAGRQDLPWALFWDGYTLNGYAWYDGQGQFTELTIWGTKDRASFTLELRLGALPFTCVVDPDREVSDAFGAPVTGWSRVYDRDGDSQADYICGSEFMTENNIGVRFESRNCGGGAQEPMDGERWFNTLLAREVLSQGLHLDHLMTAEQVPAWRDQTYDTLDQARQEADYAPYLPESAPEGMENAEFFGRLSYQEGVQNDLFVRWIRDFDIVEVDVNFPVGSNSASHEPVDITVPESYDARLYEIPWCDSVPEEYQADFYSAAFRAEDMSLDAVMAREVPRDTGGVGFDFRVLHPNGVTVSYICSGVTAQQVWELVEPTLP